MDGLSVALLPSGVAVLRSEYIDVQKKALIELYVTCADVVVVGTSEAVTNLVESGAKNGTNQTRAFPNQKRASNTGSLSSKHGRFLIKHGRLDHHTRGILLNVAPTYPLLCTSSAPWPRLSCLEA